MIVPRRTALLGGLALLSCTRKTVPSIQPRALASLPTTTLPWLTLRDHFVATVGPSAGQGKPLGPLLVLADATFSARSRFPLHSHRDMEILSLVLEGDLSHHGDGANGSVVRPRGAQLISSRDGMRHAEGNDTERATRMLQIWFEPTSRGGAPAYFYRQLPEETGQHLVAGDESMPLRCDARVWWLDLSSKRSVEVAPGRRGYLMAIAGPLAVSGATLSTGEGAMVSPGTLELEGPGAALWIDLAGS